MLQMGFYILYCDPVFLSPSLLIKIKEILINKNIDVNEIWENVL